MHRFKGAHTHTHTYKQTESHMHRYSHRYEHMENHIGRIMSCPWCHICYPGPQDNLFLPVYHYEVILSWKGSTEIDVLTDTPSRT